MKFSIKTKEKGFTLLEILVVLLIISIIIAAVSLTLFHRDTSPSITTTINTLRSRMLFTQQQATLLNKTLGLSLKKQSYKFMQFTESPSPPHWQPLEENNLNEQNWPPKLNIKLALGNIAFTDLNNSYPDTPQLIFSPSGEITSFQISINNQYIITSNTGNKITISKVQ